MDEQRQKLLENVVNVHARSYCSLVTSHAGTLLILEKKYHEVLDEIGEFITPEELNNFYEVETFIFLEGMPVELRTHRKSIRVGWIIDVVEVTSDMWQDILLDQANRKSQQAIQGSPLNIN